VEHLRVPEGLAMAAAVAALRKHPAVRDAQPNYVRHLASSAPNDPYWVNGSLWGMQRIDALSAWTTYGPGGTTVVVADIDTGVNYNHPDLAANMWRNPGEIPGNGIDDDGNGYIDDVFGIDTVNRDSDPMDDHGHGTHTAGTIAGVANNGIGVVGVAANVRILTCKFISASGTGTDSGAVECFNYVVAQKNRGVNVRVTSNSWGGARSGGIGTVLKNAIDAAGNAGIVNVFAAGNAGTNNDVAPFDPASFPSSSIVSVAASDQSDARAGFSNYGASSVHLAAPGTGIVSTHGNGYASSSGTSMATPHVAGAAALLLAHVPSATVPQVKNALMSSVDTLAAWNGLVASGGRLNAFRLLGSLAVNHPPTVTLTAPLGGSSFTAPASIALAANASDSDGTVARVDFFANGTLVGSDTTSPFALTWSGVAAGNYRLTAVARDNGGLTATSSPVDIVVVAPTVGSGTSASFVKVDTTTQGNWRGVYGSQGYVVVNDTTALPAYAAVQPAGHLSWTWDAAPTSTRALQRSTGSGRIAATWYAGSSFTVNVNLTDGVPHQVALHAIDWDSTTRAQRIDVIDASTGAVLDSRMLSGFTNGQYLVWQVQGHVRFQVVRTGGANAVVGGIFLDAPIGAPQPPTVSLTAPAHGASFTAPASIGLAASASDSDGTVARVDFYANGALVGSDTTSPFAVTWSGVAAGSYRLTARATDDSGLATTSAPVDIQVVASGGGGGTSASFVRVDTTTQGNWRTVYGSSGFVVVNDATSLPAYATVQPSGHASWTWDSAPISTRALQRASGTGRIAATWYANTSFSVNVNLTDGGLHQVSLHMVDWDSTTRAERIDVLDAATGTLLDSRSVTGFNGGHYLVWSVRGHVRFQVVRTGGANSVVGGVFLDPAP
jgi:hypothetical protein